MTDKQRRERRELNIRLRLCGLTPKEQARLNKLEALLDAEVEKITKSAKSQSENNGE